MRRGPHSDDPRTAEIINKTAQFVARNGPEFEARILKNEQNNTKFAFLNAKDPFNPYYRAKVRELGGEPAETPATEATGAVEVAKAATATTTTAPRVPPLEPPKQLYTVPRPVGVLPLDIDVIQLSAQCVAAHCPCSMEPRISPFAVAIAILAYFADGQIGRRAHILPSHAACLADIFLPRLSLLQICCPQWPFIPYWACQPRGEKSSGDALPPPPSGLPERQHWHGAPRLGVGCKHS